MRSRIELVIGHCTLIVFLGYLSLAGCQPLTSKKETLTAVVPTKPKVTSQKSYGEEVKNMIKKGVSLGSNRTQVESWLNMNNIEPWYAEAQKLNSSQYKAVLQENGYKPADLGGIILSLTNRKFQGSELYFQIAFFFDKNEKLVHYSVKTLGAENMKRNPRKLTVEKVRSMIKKSVPLGSNHTLVTIWLNFQKIEHSYLSSEKYNLDFQSAVSRSRHHKEDLSGIIEAIIRETSQGTLSYVDTQITFFFNKKGKLIDYIVEEVRTGL